MVNRIAYIFLVLLVWACSAKTPRRIVKAYEYRYESERNEVSNLRIDGFYTIKLLTERRKFVGPRFSYKQVYVEDTLFRNLAFFRDGTAIIDFHNTRDDTLKINSESIKKLFKDVLIDRKKAEIFNSIWKWGIYKVFNDTIKLKWINHPPPLNPYWHAHEIWFKILDNETLVEIFNGPLINQESAPASSTSFQGKPAKFIPVEQMPKANPWFKNEEWIWENKGEFMAWKLERRINRPQ